jgi:Phosphotransferase enzyme family
VRANRPIELRELNADTAVAYLTERGAISGRAEVEPLGGGISNVVLRVRSAGDCFVVKQSLPRLRVEAVWEVDRKRIFVERDCMRYLGNILAPGTVPDVRFSDDGNFLFAMSCAPPGGFNWKEALLRGEIDVVAAERAGALLAALQVRTAADPVVRERFADRTVLFQGRIDPYHRTAAAANPSLGRLIEEEVERLLAAQRTLVLGDYAPKNTLVYPSRLLLLDFEVAHWGDPAFDPAFWLNHLLLKAIRFSDRAPRYLAAARAFWRVYRAGLAGDCAVGIEWGTTRELACLLLARIDGKSKIEYITDESQRAFARDLATDVLVTRLAHPNDVFTEAEQRLVASNCLTCDPDRSASRARGTRLTWAPYRRSRRNPG